jgi:hypothetical protein
MTLMLTAALNPYQFPRARLIAEAEWYTQMSKYGSQILFGDRWNLRLEWN